HISSTNLTSIPKNLNKIGNLQYLYLENNTISDMKELKQLKHLKELSFSKLKYHGITLKDLPDSLENFGVIFYRGELENEEYRKQLCSLFGKECFEDVVIEDIPKNLKFLWLKDSEFTVDDLKYIITENKQ
ncbi:hypothetical protein LCGC14_2303870, partial [marine sediment metagenome]